MKCCRGTIHITWWTIKVSPPSFDFPGVNNSKYARENSGIFIHLQTMIWNQAACTVILLNICGAVEVEISHLSSTYSVYHVF